MNGEDEHYMRMALELASRGVGAVEPNPAVGCVIVKDGAVIGQGCHEKFGHAHAEINALADCKGRGLDAHGSTMYVTLEPCCHVGKTGPCSEAIIKAGLSRVVIATADTSDEVKSGGIRQLRKAGIEVEVGICSEEAKLLNAWFFKFAETKLPWVILKWAQSSDGKMAWKEGSGNRWISNEASREDVHKLRASVGAILAGIGTVIADDPLLTARAGGGVELLRIVLDSDLRIPLGCRLLHCNDSPKLIVTTKRGAEANADKVKAIVEKGAEVFAVDEDRGRCDLKQLLVELGRRGVRRLLIEGGRSVITSFLQDGLADAVRIYISPQTLGDQGAVSISEPMKKLTDITNLHQASTKEFDGDQCVKGLLRSKGWELPD